MAKIIKTNNEIKEVRPQDGKVWTLEELQKIVGGFIEIVRLPNGGMLIVDEEGKLKSLPINGGATAIYGFSDVIVGDCLYIPSYESNTIA